MKKTTLHFIFRLCVSMITTVSVTHALAQSERPSARVQIHSHEPRPNVYDQLRLFPNSIGQAPFHPYGEWEPYWLQKEGVKFQESIFLPAIHLDHYFPGAIWVTVGADADVFADMLEAYYNKVGQFGRVIRLGVSAGSFHSKIDDKEYRLLRDAGIVGDAPSANDRIIFLDSTTWKVGADSSNMKKSQCRMLLEAYYEKAIAQGFSAADLFRRVNVVSLGDPGPGRPNIDTLGPNEFFTQLKPEGRAQIPHMVGAVATRLDHPHIEIWAAPQAEQYKKAKDGFILQKQTKWSKTIIAFEQLEVRWRKKFSRMTDANGFVQAEAGGRYPQHLREHMLYLTHEIIEDAERRILPGAKGLNEADLPIVAVEQRFNEGYDAAVRSGTVESFVASLGDVPAGFARVAAIRQLEVLLREVQAGRASEDAAQEQLEAKVVEWRFHARELSLLAYVTNKYSARGRYQVAIDQISDLLMTRPGALARLRVNSRIRADVTSTFAKRCVRAIWSRLSK